MIDVLKLLIILIGLIAFLAITSRKGNIEIHIELRLPYKILITIKKRK